MQKSEKIKSKEAMVKNILTMRPETRNNDRELVAAYWRTEQAMLFQFRNAEAVLRALINKDLSNPDDITRARRKVQELNPELRGDNWKTRQRRMAEADVRENINKVLDGEIIDEFDKSLKFAAPEFKSTGVAGISDDDLFGNVIIHKGNDPI